MVEYIKREAAVAVCDEQYKECLRKGDFRGDTVAWDICADIKAIPTADVAPVTRCKDCKHSWEDIGGLCCSHGACVDLTVPGDFYCAYGERAEVTTICQSCGAMMDGEPCTPSK